MPISIIKEPRDKEYERLIQYAFETCKTFVLSMHREILIFYPKPRILRELEPYKANELKALYYPQINYYNPDAVLYFYECNENTKSIIMQAVTGLYEWKQPSFPEDLTFLDDKGEVWMDSISHEHMSGIYERDKDEVEFIKNHMGLEIQWAEKGYTEEEFGDAMDNLFHLIEEYFILLSENKISKLSTEVSNKESSPNYGVWSYFFHEYNISEHNLAFEIASLSNLLKLTSPIYPPSFLPLLSDLNKSSYLVQLLTENVGGNPELLYEFLEDFNQKYKKK